MAERTVEELERDAFLAEADLLATMTTSVGWQEYEKLLTAMRASAMEEMAVCEPGDVRYWQGVVGTLREILDRPHQIVATAAAVKDEEVDDEKRLLDLRRSLEMTPGLVDEL
jgi:hypothetical protein